MMKKGNIGPAFQLSALAIEVGTKSPIGRYTNKILLPSGGWI